MEINEFAGKVCIAIKKKLGEEYCVEVRRVRKNNGILLHGLIIRSGDGNVIPTIYLEPFWEAYRSGTSLGEIVRRLLKIYREDMPKEQVNMEFFRHFDRVGDRVCYRLICRKGNEELLKDIPHIPFLDLAVCFFYAYSGKALGEGSILIRNSHMELWNTDTKELLKLAQINTLRLFPWRCCSMEEVLRDIAPEEVWQEEIPDKEERERFFAEVPMQVLSNKQRMHGASCILYPNLLAQLAQGAGCNLYILPSSIHEVILLADNGRESASQLKDMIAEVNGTQVAPEEVLSDSLYYYDRLEGKVKIF